MAVEKAINCAKASLAIEGMYLTAAEETLIRKRLQGEISEEEFHQRALDEINNSFSDGDPEAK